ncbi:MAG TPA: hypothetical protein DEA26_06510 [Oceanospirillales bacterium]|nr:hypothetical protein [Oceanospirillaceae bacterium]HBS42313.1 hypothetical protein [Oceanospirillales bacterium]|tara:strand:+ start:9887 stop:10636 length:750 start_codon:yes stop_codon:yes gene_type:complete
MLEQRRADYLKAMGVTLWLPRAPLPNALAPRWLPEDPVVETPAAPATRVAQRPAAAELMSPVAAKPESSGVAQAVAAVLKPVPEPPATQNPVEASVNLLPESAESRPVVSGNTVPAFHLHFVRVSERGIWVCDSATDPEALQLFIRRVMAAFFEPVVFMNKPASFRWPFLSSRQDDQSEPVALQALKTQWQVLENEGLDYVISVGPEAAQWLQRIDVRLHCQLDPLEALQSGALAKRQLWLSLQALTAF